MSMELTDLLKSNLYPGRGIVVGRSGDGRYAVTAYFIMGRSENSRNRVFIAEGDGLRTRAYDPAKLSDPSLIIYAPVRVVGDTTIVTNGDQTDTVASALEGRDGDFASVEALSTRQFEPDPPNYTPRISALLHIRNGELRYMMSILKSDEQDPASNLRYYYDYELPLAGKGRFIHTYESDGDPLPSFRGEPEIIDLTSICDGADAQDRLDRFTDAVWGALNPDNRVSLFTRFIDLETGQTLTRIVNRHEQE